MKTNPRRPRSDRQLDRLMRLWATGRATKAQMLRALAMSRPKGAA